jgi:tetrapyrrole methylase family protein / MazG family protein
VSHSPLQVTVLSASDAGSSLPAGTAVVLRSDVATDLIEPPVDTLGDNLLNAGSWGDLLLERLTVAARDRHVAYVVPGHPLIGDETVQFLVALDHLQQVELTIEEPQFSDTLSAILMSYPGPTTFVDALSIVDVFRKSPFASGQYPISAAQTTVVTNVTSSTLSVLSSVLARHCGEESELHVISMHGESIAHSLEAGEISGAAVGSEPAYIIIPRVEGDVFYRTPGDFQRLVARLRAPDGCPWDREQTHQSLTRNLIEETYELVEALEADDDARIREELGDFVLQAWLHAQIAEERAAFTLEDVFGTVIEKLIRRHPHVFSDTEAGDAGQVVQNWETIKQSERDGKAVPVRPQPLGDVPFSLPAMMRAQNLIKRAFKGGYSPDTAAFHRQRAVAKVATNRAEREMLDDLLGLSATATARGVDLESLLRSWSVEFERSFAEDRPANNPN